MKKIYLIGMGPGDINSITIECLKILSIAEVVLYDSLINKNILNFCKQSLKISIGKRIYKKFISQYKINKILIKYLLKYKIIIRLKGGDPLIFSRSYEELNILNNINIYYKIISGLTSSLTLSSYIKIPLTLRNNFYNLLISNRCSKLKKKNCILIKYMFNKNLLNYKNYFNKFIILAENISFKNEYINFSKTNIFKYINHKGPVLIIISKFFKNFL